jgi:hypothetical protein
VRATPAEVLRVVFLVTAAGSYLLVRTGEDLDSGLVPVHLPTGRAPGLVSLHHRVRETSLDRVGRR